MKHTQGEWNNDLHDGNVYCGGMVVANCYSSLLSPETIKANAKLVAAAPELLEALQLMYELCNSGNYVGNDDLDKAFAAIKKATT